VTPDATRGSLHTGPDELSLGDRAARALLDYREGRPHALEAVVREITPLLWHTARAQGVDPQAADDVVQDTWVALVRHVETIDEPRAVLKWLLVTAKRGAWESVRRRRRDELHRTELHDTVDPETGPHKELPTPEPTPDVEVALRDRDSLLWSTFQHLPDRCRELLRLVSLADRPDYKHISAAIGMPVGSIGATRGRCLAKLRTLLDEAGADEIWRHA
jgi:RNA polymerase sigma factor (sigma-70 family)